MKKPELKDFNLTESDFEKLENQKKMYRKKQELHIENTRSNFKKVLIATLVLTLLSAIIVGSSDTDEYLPFLICLFGGTIAIFVYMFMDQYEISNEKKWTAHCLSYLLVDKFLEEVYGIKNREIVFDNGKPILIDGGKHFSISHSNDLIVLAFSDSNCGVDIEKVKLREFQSISERMGFEALDQELSRASEMYRDQFMIPPSNR